MFCAFYLMKKEAVHEPSLGQGLGRLAAGGDWWGNSVPGAGGP